MLARLCLPLRARLLEHRRQRPTSAPAGSPPPPPLVEDLQARVQAGAVSLPDDGARLAASLEQRRGALRRMSDAAEGRVLTYSDGGTTQVGGDERRVRGGGAASTQRLRVGR